MRAIATTCLTLFLVGTGAAAGDPARFLLQERVATAPLDWVDTDGKTLAYGGAHRLWIAGLGSETRAIALPWTATDGLIVGRRLVLANGSDQLFWVPLDGSDPRPHHLSIDTIPGTGSRLSRVGGLVALSTAEGPIGLFNAIGASHDHHPFNLHPFALLHPQRAATALGGNGTSLVTVDAAGRVSRFDAWSDRGTAIESLALAGEVRDVATSGSAVYLLSTNGLEIRDPSGTHDFGEIRGRSLALAGRQLVVASSEGLAIYRDATPTAQTFPVNVANDFFSPIVVSLDVGDKVQWTNGSGFHNVFSCTAQELGCYGAESNETFVSGFPSFPVWVFSHTFQQPGSNPYLCQSHALFMQGLVVVDGVSPAPEVDDGSAGIPVLVDRIDPSGSTLEISFGTAFGCPGTSRRHVFYGFSSDWPATPGGVYQTEGAACVVSSPLVWENVPDPSGQPDGLLWWLVVGSDQANREGSWGVDSQQNQRHGPGPGGSSNRCSLAGKEAWHPCTP